jgi:hypothetical protein
MRPAHRVRVVAGAEHRLGQQRECADRGLELVADVGDEVAPHRVHPARLRPVLHQHEHQLGAERGDAHRDGQGVGAQRAARQFELDLPYLAVPAHLPGDAGQLLRHQPLAAHQAHGVRRGRGLDHGVARVEQHRGGAEHLQHGRDARRDQGFHLRLELRAVALAPAEGEAGRDPHRQRDQRGGGGGRDVERGRDEYVHTIRVSGQTRRFEGAATARSLSSPRIHVWVASDSPTTVAS